jgi:hypothetical protein
MEDITPQQRAGLAVYHLMLRAMAGHEGMTTVQVAAVCAMSEEGARKMLCCLSAAGGVPLYRNSHKWRILLDG